MEFLKKLHCMNVQTDKRTFNDQETDNKIERGAPSPTTLLLLKCSTNSGGAARRMLAANSRLI